MNKILVVEDDKSISEMIQINLTEAGYLCVCLYERYFPCGTVFYPKEWLLPSGEWPLSGYGSSLWMLILAFFMVWEFWRAAAQFT